MSASLFSPLLISPPSPLLVGPKVETRQPGKWSIISPNDFALLSIFPLLHLLMKLVAIIFNWWSFLYFLLCLNKQEQILTTRENSGPGDDQSSQWHWRPPSPFITSLLHQTDWWRGVLINIVSSSTYCRAREAWLTGRPHAVGGWIGLIVWLIVVKDQTQICHQLLFVGCDL